MGPAQRRVWEVTCHGPTSLAHSGVWWSQHKGRHTCPSSPRVTPRFQARRGPAPIVLARGSGGPPSGPHLSTVFRRREGDPLGMAHPCPCTGRDARTLPGAGLTLGARDEASLSEPPQPCARPPPP